MHLSAQRLSNLPSPAVCLCLRCHSHVVPDALGQKVTYCSKRNVEAEGSKPREQKDRHIVQGVEGRSSLQHQKQHQCTEAAEDDGAGVAEVARLSE
jgi:hypothetical protein